eukprot:4794306-Heterocapsa_arctica.AAC.1
MINAVCGRARSLYCLCLCAQVERSTVELHCQSASSSENSVCSYTADCANGVGGSLQPSEEDASGL